MRNLNKFYSMCGTIRRNLGLEFYKYPIEFNKIMAIPALTYGCEN
jgi:hypothetical protein